MKILQLTAENVKRLLVVQITPGPDGNLVVIGGENGQGKTSLLDSIAMAIGGGDQIPDQPIRQGASKAQIILKTEEFTVTRTFSKTGTQLVVTGNDGVKIAGPQKLLDELTSRVSFDPLAFTRMKPEAQTEELRRLVGIDFTALDKEREAKYAERTAINRDVKNQQARADGMQRHTDAPKTPVDAEAILDRLQEAQDANTRMAKKDEAVGHATEQCITIGSKIAEAKLALNKLEELAAQWEKSKADLTKELGEMKQADLEPIKTELRAVEATNAKVKANADWQIEQQRLVELSKKAAALTSRIEQIDTEKETGLSKAKFPIDGLSFSPDGVTFNGVPFSQASAAEQLRVSVAMGFALQPKLKIALIRDGSLLSDKSLALVAQLAEEHGAQVWIERVGDGKECSVILEAGEVLEDRTKGTK